ncbi:IS1 family transposase [Hymenobacter gummosus]|uniref:IS1 family transposase n=1 Tax=Hymenobacter gummosus TaxID=1776032 RepID=UPI000F88A8F7|nr:IS1 family transposase [Hymenobacter gummosus]
MDTCPHCRSTKLRKHGLARNGKQRYCCPDCRRTSRPAPGTNAYDEARKAEILRAYQERTSLRGLTRIFGVSRQPVTSWLKKSPTATAASPDAGPAAAG